MDALRDGRIKKPVVAWVSGTCAKLFKSEVQFGHAGAKSGGQAESAQARCHLGLYTYHQALRLQAQFCMLPDMLQLLLWRSPSLGAHAPFAPLIICSGGCGCMCGSEPAGAMHMWLSRRARTQRWRRRAQSCRSLLRGWRV